MGLGGASANGGQFLESGTCFGVRRELALEVLPLQDVDKEHAGRWVDVAVGVRPRQDGHHWNTGFPNRVS